MVTPGPEHFFVCLFCFVLKVLLYYLFTYIVSKAAVIFVLLYITYVNFSGCFSDFLFTTGFEQLDYDALCHFSFYFHVYLSVVL